MTVNVSIAPLRIADEAFMVAATIERCPRQMMLRELVMNALEAAAQATDAPKQVTIDAVAIDGAAKLRIWNTGRGLSQAELLQISNLSSSLFKTVSLDGNFGMGAKAASLASNKHGLRYRSCRLGRVSQIVLGAREGVYGRVLQADPASGELCEAIDVTNDAVAAGEDVSREWTEVTLFGNSPEQDTACDPYAGDPVTPRDWVTQTLGRRYIRLPEGVQLTIAPSASGAAAPEIFVPPLAASSFDRFEAVKTEGVVIHYGYRAKDSKLPPPRANLVGAGAVVYDGEIYALTDDRRWALEAPTYGFTFAAKQCTVVVELPHAFGARPEQYRQFLRFVEGDQHQVQFADFGELVRRNLPGWLKRIIASLLPAEGDYLDEIRQEMQNLLSELGIEDLLRAPQKPKPEEPREAGEAGETPEAPPEAAKPKPAAEPPKREAPSPPQIILLEDEADIVDKALGGRAARYYPGARQVFVNARYVAFARMQAQLADEFAPFADEDTIKRLAKLTSQWAIIQRIGRTLLHSIGKPNSGWSADEVKVAQSPETMSLMVDDIDPLLAPARRRMAVQLGLEPETEGDGGFGGDAAAQRAAGDLAEAEARLQRAKAAAVPRLGPFFRQIAEIHLRQRNPEAARAWLEKGMAVDPKDPWCRYEYAGMLLAQNELDRASQLVDESVALAVDRGETFRRRQADVKMRRKDFAAAEALLNQLAAEDEHSPWPHFDLADLYNRQNQFDAAAAAAETAIARNPVPSPHLLRRRAEIEMRRGDRAAATKLLEQARAIDHKDVWSYVLLARIAMEEGRLEDALRELDATLALRPPIEPMLLCMQSEIQMKRGEPAKALALANRAVRADPLDPAAHHQLAGVLMEIGDLDAAAAAAAEAVRLSRPPGSWLFSRQAEIETRRGNRPAALAILERALTVLPDEPGLWLAIANRRLEMGDLAGADAAAVKAGAATASFERSLAARVRGLVAARRNDRAKAASWLQEAVTLWPTEFWRYFDLANHLMEEGKLDAAAELAREGLAATAAPTGDMLTRVAAFEERRDNFEAAQQLLQQALAKDGKNSHVWSSLANLMMRMGNLPAAREAAEKAVAIASAAEERAAE